MTYEWRYHVRDRVWWLYVSGRATPIGNLATIDEPTPAATAELMRKLERFYPELADAWEAA